MDAVEQGKEYFVIDRNGTKEKIEFHDYDKIYEIPGRYEKLFYDRYKCNSPETVCNLLKRTFKIPTLQTPGHTPSVMQMTGVKKEV